MLTDPLSLLPLLLSIHFVNSLSWNASSNACLSLPFAFQKAVSLNSRDTFREQHP